MTKWANLIAGGVAGTVARYLIAGWVYGIAGTAFPYGTLVVNLSGCAIIGFLAALSDDKLVLGPDAKILLMVGFCGAYTTFSTFMLETANLMKYGENLKALANIFTSVILGFLAFKIGLLIGEII